MPIGQRTDLPATATATISGSIGAQGGNSYFLTGRIDDVAVYNAALSPATIASRSSRYTTALACQSRSCAQLGFGALGAR
jgi:hypothetical protein